MTISEFSFCPIRCSFENRPSLQKAFESNCMDPITFQKIRRPVIDQCGHSFDKSTIEMLDKNKHFEQPVCPIGKEIIQTDKFIRNFFAQELMEKIEEKKAENADLVQIVSKMKEYDLEDEFKELHDGYDHIKCARKIRELHRKIKNLKKELFKTRTENEKLNEINNDLNRRSEVLSKELTEIKRKTNSP